MTLLPETLMLGPEEEATRLWRGATLAHESAATSLVSLCESLNLGIRAAEILAIQQLQKIKDKLPATINRIFRLPPPIRVIPREINDRFQHLADLIRSLQERA